MTEELWGGLVPPLLHFEKETPPVPHDPADNTYARAAAIASLTDNSGGTANNTLEAIGAVYSQTEVRNNFADLAAKVNAILQALRDAEIIAE
jgi:hypothetical protein